MKLKVRNLGPIRQGEIDLDKRFYVFVGYNNSGKTYMSQLLWSLIDKDTRDVFNRNILEKNMPFEIKIHDTENQKISISLEQIKKFYADLNSFYTKDFLEKLNVSTNSFPKFDFNILSHENAFFDLEGNYGMKIQYPNSNYRDELYLLKKNKGDTDIYIKKVDEEQFNIAKYWSVIENHFEDSISPHTFDFFASHLLRLFLSDLLIVKNVNSFFLPANRSFYPNFYKYIYSVSKEEKDEIDNALRVGKNMDAIAALSKRPYTKAMNILTESIYRLNTNGYLTSQSKYTDLIEELESIMGGKIVVKSVEGIAPIEFKLKMENGQELDMHVSSSTSNQLTTLYLYLKYWAKESDNFLVIDEPEENLHPENQIKLINLLMKFANRNNNKVLITTHSPLMTDAVNNHLHLGFLKSQGIDIQAIIENNNLPFDSAESALSHEDMGIYFFNGKDIQEYQVGDYGAFFKDFRKAEDEVRDTANILKGHIYENEKLKKQAQLKNNATT
jgi:predicted ATP-dependent endonuclease of OLD family